MVARNRPGPVPAGGRSPAIRRPPPVPRAPTGRERFADVVVEHALALAVTSVVAFVLAFGGLIVAIVAAFSSEDSSGPVPFFVGVLVVMVIAMAGVSVVAAFLGCGGAIAGIGRRMEGRSRPGEVHSVWALIVSTPVTLLGVAALIGLLLSID